MFMMSMVCFLLTVVLSLVAVAFITLMERKILGYMQIRLGPNKVGIMGILQPMSDAIKLYTKEINWPSNSNSVPFFLSPLVSLILAMMIWTVMPYFQFILKFNSSLLMLFAILGLSVYPILISGWSSNSNYSLLGSMRSLAQTISYEVSLIFIILSNMILCSSMNIYNVLKEQKYFMFIMFFISFFLWMVSTIAELNRTPFDFAEGESELVSGFNTEYSSGLFAIIFMAEYMMILFFSVFSMFIFMGFKVNSLMNLIFIMGFMFFYIWVRATLPRYRYDKLMYLCWKLILPLSTFNLFLCILMSIMTK